MQELYYLLDKLDHYKYLHWLGEHSPKASLSMIFRLLISSFLSFYTPSLLVSPI